MRVIFQAIRNKQKIYYHFTTYGYRALICHRNCFDFTLDYIERLEKKITNIVENNGIYNLVKLDGILIAIVDEQNSSYYIQQLKENEVKTKEELKEIMKTFDTNENAVGIILLETEKNKIKINPLIWVKTIDTLYYETACGSGSLGTAIYKNYMERKENLEIVQPSGYSISVKLDMQKEYIEKAIIMGKVIEEK